MCAVVLQATSVGAAPSGGALPPPITLVLQVAGEAGVPLDAIGVALNVTVTNPAASGFLTVYPCGDRPLASNLNYVPDQTVPNFVVAGLDSLGEVCIDTMAITDVIVDIAGYIPSDSPIVPLPAPARFVDTRSGLGAPLRRVAGGAVLEVSLAGGFGVPADAATVIFNATAVQPSASGFLTVFPCGQSIPETSSLNFTPGAIVPNLVISAVGSGGKVCFFSNVETDVVADVAAYVPSGALGLTTLDRPHRLVDTRIGLGGPLAQVDAGIRTVAIGGQAGVPEDATAAIVNLTATGAAAAGYAAAFPCGGAVPLVSNLNFTAGANVANLAIVKLAHGSLCMTANRPVDIVIDILGYTAGDSALVPIVPSRLYDSRVGVGPQCNIGVRPAGSWVEMVDLATGLARPLPLFQPPTPTNPPFSAFVVPGTCDVYVITSSPPSVPNVYAYHKDGQLFMGKATEIHAYQMMATPSGLLAVLHDYKNVPVVVDVFTRQVVFNLPPTEPVPGGPLRLWTPIGASSDGSLLAFQVPAPDGVGYQVGYFTDTGEPLGVFSIPNGYLPVAMSPDGVYLAVLAGNGGLQSFDVAVTTLTGEIVSRSPASAAWIRTPAPSFMGPGSILGCSSGNGTTFTSKRWDLFSDPAQVLAPPSPVCLLAAG
jgi:hypothetical protein